jgi:hypothetical protein
LEYVQKIVQKNSESGRSRNSEKPTAEERVSCVIWRGFGTWKPVIQKVIYTTILEM